MRTHYLNADQKTAKLATGTVPQVEVGIFTMSRSNWDDVKGAEGLGGFLSR